MEDERTQRPRPRRRLGRILIPILTLLLLAAAGTSVYLYLQMQSIKRDPQAAAQAEVTDLISEVGQLILLPGDETPTVATVADPEKLKEQAFFAKAKAGYKVLLYTNAKKAILYDPDTKKIVEVAPINIGDTKATDPSPKTPTPPAAPVPEVAGQNTETPPPSTPSP